MRICDVRMLCLGGCGRSERHFALLGARDSTGWARLVFGAAPVENSAALTVAMEHESVAVENTTGSALQSLQNVSHSNLRRNYDKILDL